jgi:hypothetical protein
MKWQAFAHHRSQFAELCDAPNVKASGCGQLNADGHKHISTTAMCQTTLRNVIDLRMSLDANCRRASEDFPQQLMAAALAI